MASASNLITSGLMMLMTGEIITGKVISPATLPVAASIIILMKPDQEIKDLAKKTLIGLLSTVPGAILGRVTNVLTENLLLSYGVSIGITCMILKSNLFIETVPPTITAMERRLSL